MFKKLKIIILLIILIALILAIITSIYYFKTSIKSNVILDNTIINAHVVNDLYINSTNAISNPDMSNQITTTTNETISSTDLEYIQPNTSIQKDTTATKKSTSTSTQKNTQTNSKTTDTTNKNISTPIKNTNNTTNNVVSNSQKETKSSENNQTTTTKTEKEDTSSLANTTYRKTNNDIVPEIMNILTDEISQHSELVSYGSKALKGNKSDAYKNTTGFTYLFVKDILKGKVSGNYTIFEQRVRNNVGARGKYYVYAEDEYAYDSSGKNPRWSQTLVWIYVTF